MCYAIPGKIIRIDGESALVDYDGVKKQANVSLLGNARAGDYVLVHAGFAIQRIDAGTARENIRAARRMMEHG